MRYVVYVVLLVFVTGLTGCVATPNRTGLVIREGTLQRGDGWEIGLEMVYRDLGQKVARISLRDDTATQELIVYEGTVFPVANQRYRVTQIQIGRSGVLPGTSGGFIVCEPVR